MNWNLCLFHIRREKSWKVTSLSSCSTSISCLVVMGLRISVLLYIYCHIIKFIFYLILRIWCMYWICITHFICNTYIDIHISIYIILVMSFSFHQVFNCRDFLKWCYQYVSSHIDSFHLSLSLTLSLSSILVEAAFDLNRVQSSTSWGDNSYKAWLVIKQILWYQRATNPISSVGTSHLLTSVSVSIYLNLWRVVAHAGAGPSRQWPP